MINQSTIICLNGPPRCGKDTIAKIIQSQAAESLPEYKVVLEKFAAPLDRIAASILNIDVTSSKFLDLREDQKEHPLIAYGMGNVSMRDLLIAISEELIKPRLGITWFAQDAINRISTLLQEPNTIIIFSDSGFQYEYEHFKRGLFNFKSTDVQLINVYRHGCDFENDSRHYVRDWTSDNIYNYGSLDDLRSRVKQLWFQN